MLTVINETSWTSRTVLTTDTYIISMETARRSWRWLSNRTLRDVYTMRVGANVRIAFIDVYDFSVYGTAGAEPRLMFKIPRLQPRYNKSFSHFSPYGMARRFGITVF